MPVCGLRLSIHPSNCLMACVKLSDSCKIFTAMTPNFEPLSLMFEPKLVLRELCSVAFLLSTCLATSVWTRNWIHLIWIYPCHSQINQWI